MEHQGGVTEDDVGPSFGERNPPGALSQSRANQDQRQSELKNDWQLQQREAMQLEFQESHLSPSLPLLPVASGVGLSFTEASLFQQSDAEFAPLRAYPDVSVASERLHVPLQDCTTHSSEASYLSQHPLAQATILSDEGTNNYCTSSPQRLSSGNKSKQEETAPPVQRAATDNGQELSREGTGRARESETLAKLTAKHVGDAIEDEIFFLSEDIPAEHLLDLLQEEVGMQSSSSSAVSLKSQTSMKNVGSLMDESKTDKVCEPVTDQSAVKREHPPGEASVPQQQTKLTDQSRSLSSEVGNITTGSRCTRPDDSSELLHRELLSEAQRRSSLEAKSKNKQHKFETPSSRSFSSSLKDASDRRPGGRADLSSVPRIEPFSAGTEWVQREDDFWCSRSKTGIDGSYLGFLPQSQSTPGVFLTQVKSSVKTKLGQLSAIKSGKNYLYQSDTGNTPQPAVSKAHAHPSDTANQSKEDALQTSAQVQSLPSLNYMQKVDAWRAKQSSEFNSPELDGLFVIAPKINSCDEISDSLNQILSQQAQALQRPSVTGAATKHATQSSSSAPSGSSSPRRGEAVGGGPSDKDNIGSAGRSQSHSSLSTVIMSAHKHQQTDMPPEEEWTQSQDDAPHPPSTTVHPSLVTSLGHFSDVSPDQDLTLSSSQDSYRGINVGASVGTSSVVSLELDHYASYWTQPPSKPQELNIDEQIPLYLYNLGIDQSPSKILTPFAPRGPIREPEFSPTDLCTIKGSIGTPSKSTQPSEGNSPHKGEFSRSSVLSVDSSISIPFSLNSLGPAASITEQVRVRTSPPSESQATQSEGGPAPCSQPDEGPCSSTQPPSHQQQDGRQLADITADSSSSIKARGAERNSDSPFQSSQCMDQDVENSFARSKDLSEIHKLLCHADNIISTGSFAAFPATAPTRLFSDENIFRSLSSSSTAGDHRTRSSLLGPRSSSDSMLILEKTRKTFSGQERMTPPFQPDYPSTQTPITSRSAAVTHSVPQEGAVSSPGTSPSISKSARRTEPEGCSAAPPDKIPTQLQFTKPSPAANTQQLDSSSADRGGIPEEEEMPSPGSTPPQSRSSSSVIHDADQEVMSDGSSDSSLAVRVAKLLQSDSPATMVSSTPSITDQEESKTREWIKIKAPGQRAEPLELDIKDRNCIDQIKKELLLRNPIKSQGSTDAESSASSSPRVHKEHSPPHSTKMFSTLIDADNQHVLGMEFPESLLQPQSNVHPDLEARVCEIAAREGVTIPKKTPHTLTSITISSRRSGASPSPPLSPATHPLLLTELSTEPGRPTGANKRPPPDLNQQEVASAQTPSVFEGSFHIRDQSVTSQSALWNQKRRDTVGGQWEAPPPPSQGLDQTNATVRCDDMQRFSHQEALSSHASSGHRPHQAAGLSFDSSISRTGLVSHVHLSPSPKPPDQFSGLTVPSAHPDAASGLPQQDSIPKDSASAASSPDEGVALSSPPEWLEGRQPGGQQVCDSTIPFKSVVLQGQSVRSFPSQLRPEPGAFSAETPVPLLLPYQPRGSNKLFYIPQTEADVSSTDTSMESTHTGSDDAVPPHFSSQVLGNQDPGLDRGVSFRHTEGIYSKRVRTATVRMTDSEHTVGSSAADRNLPAVSRALKSSSQASATRSPPLTNHSISMRDQGTSPLPFLHYEQTGTNRGRSNPVHEETIRSPVPQRRAERDGSQLDQLWLRFYTRWTTEESRPTSDREASLLEHLELLTRFIHHTRAAGGAGLQEEGGPGPEEQLSGKTRRMEPKGAQREVRRSKHGEIKRRVREAEPPVQLVEETFQPEEEGGHTSFSSTYSHSSSQSHHLSTADREESSSTVSSSMSSVDTARLVRAFGSHRVQHLKSSSTLMKLYSSISKQREEREPERGTTTNPRQDLPPSQTTDSDGSVAPDSESTPHRGPSTALTAKRTPKRVNKSVQAGDLEIVKNGTRRHTRDVGTTFPSPGEAFRQISSFSAVRGRRGQRSPKPQSVQKQRKNKNSKHFPKGVSWFISADSLKSETKKENQPEESSAWRPSTAWFEPCSEVRPWREPLRLRQVHTDSQSRPEEPGPDQDPKTRTVSSGLTRVSLQEALELHRPEFISRSRQRVRCLALQAEERKLHTVFSRERNVLFNQSGGVVRLPEPKGTALLRRAVPRREMIQRSKQMYENLPEVQRRREEERRRAEYQSYRLNARLYNKRITNRVLGRRAAWR